MSDYKMDDDEKRLHVTIHEIITLGIVQVKKLTHCQLKVFKA